MTAAAPGNFNTMNSRNGRIMRMTSTFHFDYKTLCKELILHATERPRMYFRADELGDLEKILFGHGEAFSQLGIIREDETFNASFRNWIYEQTKESVSGGWHRAVAALVPKKGINQDDAFANLVNEFFRSWCDR
jgi:hypothetical protein